MPQLFWTISKCFEPNEKYSLTATVCVQCTHAYSTGINHKTVSLEWPSGPSKRRRESEKSGDDAGGERAGDVGRGVEALLDGDVVLVQEVVADLGLAADAQVRAVLRAHGRPLGHSVRGCGGPKSRKVGPEVHHGPRGSIFLLVEISIREQVDEVVRVRDSTRERVQKRVAVAELGVPPFEVEAVQIAGRQPGVLLYHPESARLEESHAAYVDQSGGHEGEVPQVALLEILLPEHVAERTRVVVDTAKL